MTSHHDHDHDHDGDDDDDDDDEVLMEVCFFNSESITSRSFHQLIQSPSLATVSAALDFDPTLTVSSDDDDDKKKRRRKYIKFIVSKVLQYHGLPEALTSKEIAQNVTIATALKADDGSFGGLQRRIRVVPQLIPPCESYLSF